MLSLHNLDASSTAREDIELGTPVQRCSGVFGILKASKLPNGCSEARREG